jgi:hypothetical protein
MKNQFRACDERRNSAKYHCTIPNTTKKAAPSASDKAGEPQCSTHIPCPAQQKIDRNAGENEQERKRQRDHMESRG